ncbi:Ig-like domain-containing protein [Desulfobulbus alkaliphilus]|uniref:Ig-like domain-containing protein n=1 Tax=Desulfobulbus alkaliphilus TaxID=869814 RepID=UPI0019652EB6|nr:Ig-like domain-containing protein [Desulfobulbus alkaliphilus]MBM9538540.1 Ig-like domain-containing protein [Desulfobulbus alkaliphilus]
MIDDQDTVLVHGDFITQSRHSHSNRLTKGTLEVRGDFIQKTGHAYNFNATGTHKVVLGGQQKQNVSFSSPAQSGFQTVILVNDQDNKIVFPQDFRVRSTVLATRTLDHLQMAVGETADIQASINFPGHQVTWKSFKPEIAQVSSSGSVKGENEGKARIKTSSLTDPDLFLYTWVEVVHDPIAPDLAEVPGEHVHVGELEGMDRITIRALRGWSNLPPKFDRLALDLRGKGIDILGYDLSQIQDLANQAKEPDSPLQAQGADLKELAELMAEFDFQKEIELSGLHTVEETESEKPGAITTGEVGKKGKDRIKFVDYQEVFLDFRAVGEFVETVNDQVSNVNVDNIHIVRMPIKWKDSVFYGSEASQTIERKISGTIKNSPLYSDNFKLISMDYYYISHRDNIKTTKRLQIKDLPFTTTTTDWRQKNQSQILAVIDHAYFDKYPDLTRFFKFYEYLRHKEDDEGVAQTTQRQLNKILYGDMLDTEHYTGFPYRFALTFREYY